MLFVVLMHYTKPLPEIDAVRAEHVAHLERAAAQGTMLAWARRDPPSGGVLIASAADRVALERVVAEDPYVLRGVATAEIVEFNPRNVKLDLTSASPTKSR